MSAIPQDAPFTSMTGPGAAEASPLPHQDSTSAASPHAAEVGNSQTPGEYVGEAESRESDQLARYIEERLVTPRPDCLIWTAATDRGYGRVFLDGTAKRVHRVVWEMQNGPIPDGLTIDHLCRVRACCNTAHMELVTGGENVRRPTPYRPTLRRNVTASRDEQEAARTHCRFGHEYTPENTNRRPSGARQCRACRKAQKEREREKRRAQSAA